MQKRAFVFVVLALLLLFACESKTTGKRVAIPELSGQNSPITGAVAGVASDEGSGQTAAEALAELKSEGTVAPVASGPKTGTFYPPIQTTATGKEALKEKTRALFQTAVYEPKVEASAEFGPRYHDGDGDLTNLPEGYEDNDGD